jgi:hypothetical protein
VPERLPNDGIRLQPEQERLLAHLVEAHRSQPHGKQYPFNSFTELGGPHFIVHAAFEALPDRQLVCNVSDEHILRQAGLISFIDQYSFYVTPRGFDHYGQTKARLGEPVRRVEQEVHSYLDAEVFRQQCPAAYDKWADAERHLWSARVEEDLTRIGHCAVRQCRGSRPAWSSASSHPTSIRTSSTTWLG